VRLLIATTNRHKVREISPLLSGIPFELITLDAVPPIAAPEENGPTFEANARTKALYYSRATGLPAVAEDSGLEIDALGGAPGVESARYGGVDASYPEKFRLIYDALGGKGVTTSAARFVCALAFVEGDRVRFETRGTVEGAIAPAPQGTGGFGYDPIFFYPPFGCTLAEAGPRKSSVSHRGAAFRALRAFFQSQA
jgi:non-canonical purine NTP pyrophosphatase (RdgB/HAM1 family)